MTNWMNVMSAVANVSLTAWRYDKKDKTHGYRFNLTQDQLKAMSEDPNGIVFFIQGEEQTVSTKNGDKQVIRIYPKSDEQKQS